MIRRILSGARDTLAIIGWMIGHVTDVLRSRWKESALCPYQSIGCKTGSRCQGCWEDGIW